MPDDDRLFPAVPELGGRDDAGFDVMNQEDALAMRYGQIAVAAPIIIEAAGNDPDEALFADFRDDEPQVLGVALAIPGAPVARQGAVYVAQEIVIDAAVGALPRIGYGNEPRYNLVDPAPVQVKWGNIGSLVGYMGAGRGAGREDAIGKAIRAMGRIIFRAMPCFCVMEDRCRAAGRDPLAEVAVLANISGRGPNTSAEIDATSAWIRRNGSLLDAAHVEFPDFMAGYRPRIILAADDRNSYIMVEDRVQDGCPLNATYIYSWQGGRQVYLDNPDMASALERIGGARVVQAPGMAPVTLPGAAPITHPDSVGAHPVAIIAPVPVVQARIREPKPVVALARVIPPPRIRPTGNHVQILRQSGFKPFGTPEGPAMKLGQPDGGYILARGEDRNSLALAQVWKVAAHDSFGVAIPGVESNGLNGANGILDWVEAQTISMPRPR